LPVQDSEQKRLNRVIVDAQTFLAGLERLLVVVDGSANGSLAVRIAGLLAGMRGTPVTLLRARDGEAAPVELGGAL
jgi:nucleotide-binding universal stress UspA family protein